MNFKRKIKRNILRNMSGEEKLRIIKETLNRLNMMRVIGMVSAIVISMPTMIQGILFGLFYLEFTTCKKVNND